MYLDEGISSTKIDKDLKLSIHNRVMLWEYSSYLRSRSSARSFIRNKTTLKDLKELEQLILGRKNNL